MQGTNEGFMNNTLVSNTECKMFTCMYVLYLRINKIKINYFLGPAAKS
jgi:hypothetical protein